MKTAKENFQPSIEAIGHT